MEGGTENKRKGDKPAGQDRIMGRKGKERKDDKKLEMKTERRVLKGEEKRQGRYGEGKDVKRNVVKMEW